MRRRLAALVAALAMFVPMFVIGGSTPANAYVGPGDDRQKTTPTGWWFYTGVDQTFITNFVNANGARITDIQVESVGSPMRYSVTFVRNTGTYYTPWYWYTNVTVAQAHQEAINKQARIIKAQVYNTSAGQRATVVMVSNTGTYAEAWWWYVNASVSFISSKLSQNQARLVSISSQNNGTYTAVMARNTGNDATGWWWYVNASTTFISQKLAENKARIVDLDRNANGTFNVVMYYNPNVQWYWWVNASPSTLLQRAQQNGQRIIDFQTYFINGVKYAAAVMHNNLDSLSFKLKEIIRPTIDSGKYGFYVKHVGGSRLAGLQDGTQFEPASSLKVLYHLKAIDALEAGTATDSGSVTYYYKNLSDPADGNICPNTATTSTTTLKNADEKMMWNSDNRMTRAILDKFGKPAMLSLASSIGMTATSINHNIGCGTPHNYTTLYDLGRVYETFQNGSVVANTTWRAAFRSRMLNEANTSIRSGTLCPIVNQEAASLGKSASTASAFCSAMTWISKGGSYQYAGAYPYTVSWSVASMTGIPYKSSGTVAPKFFVFGDFVDGTQINSLTERNTIGTARTKLYQEAMRPYIRSALSTWA